jgi:MraZ protein
MFVGTHEHNIDPKGRINIPSKYREILFKKHNSLIITLIIHYNCILVYPQEVWEKEFLTRYQNLDPFDPDTIEFQRSFFSMASETEVNEQGRILIPPTLRDQAGLEKEIIIVGAGNRFEIWDKTRWQQRSVSPENNGWTKAAQVSKRNKQQG